MKKFLLLAVLALSSMSILAYDAKIDGIYYNFSGDNAEVTYLYYQYPSNSAAYSGNVVIPESVTYNGKPYSVTSIGYYAFFGCSGLTSVTIPGSVTSIGDDAFSGTAWYKNQPDGLVYAGKVAYKYKGTMPSDTHITLEEGTLGIAGGAFRGCSRLTSVTIPESVTSIGDEAFENCSRLHTIYCLNPIPPTCSSIHTFECDDLRNIYDVYSYATLHVPMGCKELYSSAYEWRYFNKIKEDMEMNGQVFYTTLSVNQAGDGYVKHYVKADEPYTLFIGSEAGMRINTVMFNGEDVTDRMIDGYYTTPNITRPSKIVVSYEQDPDGVVAVPADDNLHVYGNEGSLYVSGIEEPQRMYVYTLDGKLTSTQMLEGDTRVKLNDGIYIVKVGERTFKVSL